MMPDHEAAIQAATEALVAALLAAVRDEGATREEPADRLLSIPEAAAMLSLGRSAVYDEIAAGRLHSVKVGRRRLVPSRAIAAYIAAAR
jgi:excisionase family DNA binding protein